MADESRPYAYETETRLLRWGHTSTAGMTITLELDPTIEGPNPFGLFKSGPTGGQRFRMRFEPILDDETAIAETQAEALGKRAITIGVMLSKDPAFLTWLQVHRPNEVNKAREKVGAASDEDVAKQSVRELCGVDSLSLLPVNIEARDRLYALENAYRVSLGQRAKESGG